MAPMLGLSCTFMACVFDRPGWKLYSNHVMGLWWAYVGSLGGSAGPMFGLCWAKRCRHLGLCSANFNPDLRKIRSGLRKTALFGPCPSHIGPILQQLAHPLLGLHVAILHCIKLNLTWRIFWLKMRLSSSLQRLFCLDGQTNKGWKHKATYIYILYYIYIYSFIFWLI